MAYSKKFQRLGEAARARVDGVDVADIDALVAAGAVVLDIRDAEEFAQGTMPGAINLSRGTLEMNIEGLVPDLQATILCFCNANHRGSLSASTLKDLGYDNAKVVVGGLNAWKVHQGIEG